MRAVRLGLVVIGLGRVATAAPVPPAPPTPGDVEQAKGLYATAEKELALGAYADAARDYGVAYERSRDPVLFYKIATAREKNGECAVAVVYFRRYLKEAAPAPRFVELVTRRITACGATIEEPPPPAPVTTSPPAPPPVTVTPPAPAPRAVPPPVTLPAANSHPAAWVVGASALALAISGVVLAEAAHSSESDITDLYVGFQNTPPTYDAATQKRYQDLLDQGHRYQDLSWTAFGLGAVAAGVSAYLFTRHGDETVLVPTASAHGGGLAATWSF